MRTPLFRGERDRQQLLEELSKIPKQVAVVLTQPPYTTLPGLFGTTSNQDVELSAAALSGDRRFVHPREYVDGAADRDLDAEKGGGGICICKGNNPGRSPPKIDLVHILGPSGGVGGYLRRGCVGRGVRTFGFFGVEVVPDQSLAVA